MDEKVMDLIYNQHKENIELLYENSCNIYRFEDIKNEEMGTWIKERVIKYKELPCRISQRSLGTNNQTDAANQISYETKLFISQDIKIHQGDEIEVIRSGKTTKYVTGDPFIYPSHQEVSIQRKEWA